MASSVRFFGTGARSSFTVASLPCYFQVTWPVPASPFQVSVIISLNASSACTTARYIRVSGEHHLKAVEKGAEHILSLMKNGAEVANTESEGGQKVATKVASNPNSQKETGGCITATACQ